MQPIEVTLGGEAVKLDPPAADLRALFALHCSTQFQGAAQSSKRTILAWSALGLCVPGEAKWDGDTLEGLLAFGRSRYNELRDDYNAVEVMTAGWAVLGALLEDFNGPTEAEVVERRDFTRAALASSG